MVYEVMLYSPPTDDNRGSNKILWVRANNTDIIHEYFKDTNFEVQKIEETTLPDNMRGIDVFLDREEQ